MNRAFILILSLLAFATFARADNNTPYALNFPRPDRAEVVSVVPGDTTGPTVQLSAAQARKVAKLLRSLKWLGPAGGCDKLQYILHFYANGKQVANAGIFFHCGCFVELEADPLPNGEPVGIALQGTSVWVADGTRRLVRL